MLMPSIEFMTVIAVPAALIPITFQIMKVVKDHLGVADYTAPAVIEPKPEEGVYYSERDHGYWVKMPDGTKTLVDMSELYPNDAAFAKKPSELERFGTFIYDSAKKRMVHK